jgi:hypothetical protein
LLIFCLAWPYRFRSRSRNPSNILYPKSEPHKKIICGLAADPTNIHFINQSKLLYNILVCLKNAVWT